MSGFPAGRCKERGALEVIVLENVVLKSESSNRYRPGSRQMNESYFRIDYPTGIPTGKFRRMCWLATNC
jgi:hypothetical protein